MTTSKEWKEKLSGHVRDDGPAPDIVTGLRLMRDECECQRFRPTRRTK